MQGCLLLAAQLIGRLSHEQQNKDALREAGAIVALLKLLRPKNVEPSIAEAVCQGLTILAVSNEVNQDYIRCWTSRLLVPARSCRQSADCMCKTTPLASLG